MSAVDIAGWLGTFGVLATYAVRRQAFDLANAVLWPAVAAPAAVRGAWSAVAISFTFGAIGTVRLVRRAA